jgi:uncharacterized membrane protein
MKYRLIAMFLLLLMVFQATAAVENTSTAANVLDGIVRVPSIELTIDSSGMVSIKEGLIVRRGEIVGLTIFSNVQNLQLLDSVGNKVNFNRTQNNGNQVISFILEKQANISEEDIILKYDTQDLTSKSGDLWNLTYSTAVTPIGSSVPSTFLRLYMPNNTQIQNISVKDFYFSPMGSSGIEIYPLVSDFSLSFTYKLGVFNNGTVIPRNSTNTTTTLPVTTTTTPSEFSKIIIEIFNQINNIYYILVFSVILAFLLGVFNVYLKHKRAKEELKLKGSAPEKAKGGHSLSEPLREHSGNGGGFSVESVNHDFEVVAPSSGVGSSSRVEGGVVEEVKSAKTNGSEDKEEFVDAPIPPKKAVKGPRRIKESVRNVLDETELKVIDMLLKFEDEITQAYIYKTTGIPKSSLSDTIKRLEKRNIIDRRKDGRINWIKIKDWVFD